MKTKVCNKCKNKKPLDQFYKNSKGKYGRSQSCNICSRQAYKDYRERYPHKVFASKYKADQDEIKNLLNVGFCMICSDHESKLVIDHCHKTGNIRGRLCNNCNSALGLLKDDPFFLKKAAAYLENQND